VSSRSGRGGGVFGRGAVSDEANAEKAGLSISGSDNIESSKALISESNELNENRSARVTLRRCRRVEATGSIAEEEEASEREMRDSDTSRVEEEAVETKSREILEAEAEGEEKRVSLSPSD
jgi:hypothetical protein